MPNLSRAISIVDLERMARRRLPAILFEAIESGVEDEACLQTNQDAFKRQRFLPRACVDVSVRRQATTLFGAEHRSPFGVSPTGVAGAFRRGAEHMLAQAAKEAGLPFILSGACMAELEAVARIAPDTTWFQLYPARNPAIRDDMVRRADAAGVGALVLTIDNPVLPKRERDMRNGFALPLRLRPRTVLDVLAHPSWLMRYLADGGLPTMETWARYAPPGASASTVAQFFRSQSPTVQTWRDLERFRGQWPRKLVLKGVLRPEDAVRAAGLGFDGIILSNHGGKALDRVPSPMEVLPAVRRAVPAAVPVMIDSGVRRGSDVVAALCLGADFVFAGRAMLYAVAAAGLEGARRAATILRDEIDLTLALLGCPDVAELGPSWLYPTPLVGPTPRYRASSPTDSQGMAATSTMPASSAER